MTSKKPSVFIGSSVKGEPIARAVEENLAYKSETYLWSHVFPPGKSNLESLVENAAKMDFAALVLTPDDLIESKGLTMNSPRDNVLFELGLFMGKLGRERTFAVYNHDEQIKLPSDLAGVTPASYPNYKGNNLRAQVSSACTPILRAIDVLGPLSHSFAINPHYDADLLRLDGKWNLQEVMNQKTVIIVVGDNLVSGLLDRPTAGLLRDEIDSCGESDLFKRAVIIGHSPWTNATEVHGNPTISIGAAPTNKLSGEILKTCQALGKDRFELGPGAWGVFTLAIPPSSGGGTTLATVAIGPRVALWGQKAAETRAAVENYIHRPMGLRHFLDDDAGWKKV
jgi:hypothetical protein